MKITNTEIQKYLECQKELQCITIFIVNNIINVKYYNLKPQFNDSIPKWKYIKVQNIALKIIDVYSYSV